ncbi:unnamed protein product, partial [Rotaria sp. Silwood1]
NARDLEYERVIDEYIDQLFNTFRTPFWLNEHGWFVRCDWNSSNLVIYIYTLPYAFDTFWILYPLCHKSTCPQKNNKQSYDTVRYLRYNVASVNDIQQSDVRFYKLEKLEIGTSLIDYFWSMIPAFDH